MNQLRVGTRGSDLALVQTRSVCAQLAAHTSDLVIEEVIIATHGDQNRDQAVTADDWPMGGFTGAIERALLERRIDFAVHSLKDLPVAETAGTRIAATPIREPAHDVLVTASSVALDSFPPNLRLGTSSPRRAAQIRRLGPIETVEIRGNVPTRVSRVGKDLDGVIVAAAGLSRLRITPRYVLNLPLDRFLPAAGQGALAVQVRTEDDEITKLIAAIDDHNTRGAVDAERAFLARMGGGCSAPIGAYATVCNGEIHLSGQVFYADGRREAFATAKGVDPLATANMLAETMKEKIREGLV